jgi:hypothetical protein
MILILDFVLLDQFLFRSRLCLKILIMLAIAATPVVGTTATTDELLRAGCHRILRE